MIINVENSSIICYTINTHHKKPKAQEGKQMSSLKDMTPTEEFNYNRLTNKGYTHEEAIAMLEIIRAIPEDEMAKFTQAIRDNIIRKSYEKE